VRRFPHADRVVADAIAQALEKAGLSGRQAAVKMKRAHNYVSRFASGERVPNVSEFIYVARALGIRPATLLERIDRRLGRRS
jgi:ribosome-binding protein aMBF1 (putative translation factor)